MSFDELVGRIESITKLNRRAAQVIATTLTAKANDDQDFSAGDIVRAAESLGYEFERPEGVEPTPEPTPAHDAEVTMDPAEVLDEVYMVMPRVLCENMPKIGRAPAEAQEHFSELIEQLPEEVRALLVKIDLLEGKATFWLRDEANDVDRPIGPIDLTRYDDAHALSEAFDTLLRRLEKVLAADFN